MSSRSFGLLAGWLVSHCISHPASCFLINSGSSVRNRMRPCSRTLSGRFSVLRSSSDEITSMIVPLAACHRSKVQAWSETPILRVTDRTRQFVQSPPREDFLKFVEQRAMHQTIRRHRLSAGDLEFSARKVRNLPPSLFYDQHAGRRIPGFEI